MIRYFLTLSILGGAVLLGQQLQQPGKVHISWNGERAVLDWSEELADPKAAAGEVPFSILTGPYLSWLTPDSAMIGWEVVAEKNLTTKPYASFSATFPAERIKFRSALLTGLKPDTTYRYQLRSKGGNYTFTSKELPFRTFPAIHTPTFRFAVVGDTQRGDNKPEAAEVERNLFALMNDWNPTLLLHMGDLLDTGRGDGINGRKSWYRAFERNRQLRASTFMAPTIGNHCWLGKGHGWFVDYFPNLTGPAREQEGIGPRPPFFYSFDAAQVHFVSLCTEAAKVSGGKDVSDQKLNALPFTYQDQLAWLEQDLAATKQPWKVIYFHKPMHTVGPYPCSDAFRNDVGALMHKYGVQVVMSGHDHSYQKTVRLDNLTRKPSATGTVQLISGGGDTTQFDRKIMPDWNLIHRKINHYVQVEVTPDAMRFTAVDVQGKAFDRWQLPQQGQPEVVALEGK